MLRKKRVARYAFIKRHRGEYRLSVLCRAMKVSESAYYAWKKGLTYRVSTELAELTAKIRKIFFEHRRRYGARRITAELRATGVKIGRKPVIKIMKREGLEAIQSKRFVPKTTDSKHDLGYSPNLLKEVEIDKLTRGEVIVRDITYLPLRNGRYCFLGMFQDKFTKRIVGWQVADNMRAELVIGALLMAKRRGLIGKNAIIHTDRGSQYGARDYRKLLKGI
ncbi:MAG: IS3 family transposase [Pyrinomonadaceae bacterium]